MKRVKFVSYYWWFLYAFLYYSSLDNLLKGTYRRHIAYTYFIGLDALIKGYMPEEQNNDSTTTD